MPDAQSQPTSPGARPSEVAELYVTHAGSPGYYFSDWETVWVQHRWREGEPQFRFTAAERDPMPGLWSRLQFIPGDYCIIKLGGVVALTGIILVRQTAYDANSHGVSLQGVGIQWIAYRASVVSQTMTFPGNYVTVADQLLAQFASKAVPLGKIDGTEFKPPTKVNPGDTVWNVLETLGRTRKVGLGSDPDGNIVLIGDHESPIVDSLDEGVNILSCQCVINIQEVHDPYIVWGQKGRSDEGSPPDAAHQESIVRSTIIKTYTPLLTPIEHPVWTKDEVDIRARTEAQWHDGTIVEATVVVQGWFTRSGILWPVGASVIFNSPMTTLNNYKMSIRSVTFTQDRQSGSRTTLDLVAPWLLNDYGIIANATGTPDPAPAAGGEGSATSPDPNTTPMPAPPVYDPGAGPG